MLDLQCGTARAEAQVRRSKKTAAPPEHDSTAGFDKIYSLIKGQTTIIKLVPEGSIVKKGQIVCELDSAALKDQLVNQQITVKSAEANLENAKLARVNAEYDQSDILGGSLSSGTAGERGRDEGCRVRAGPRQGAARRGQGRSVETTSLKLCGLS